jgi:hypothetical protein
VPSKPQPVRPALRRLDREGAPVTFVAAATAAAVSRTLSTVTPTFAPKSNSCAPPTRPAPAASCAARNRRLAQRIETLLDSVYTLCEENSRLREQIAALLGEQRAATNPSSTQPPR